MRNAATSVGLATESLTAATLNAQLLAAKTGLECAERCRGKVRPESDEDMMEACCKFLRQVSSIILAPDGENTMTSATPESLARGSGDSQTIMLGAGRVRRMRVCIASSHPPRGPPGHTDMRTPPPA